MHNRKKGQITIFIAIGLVLLIFIAFLTFRIISSHEDSIGHETGRNTHIGPQFVPLNNLITSCLDKTAKEAVIYISLQGGHFYLEEPSVQSQFMFMDIPIYYQYGIKMNPDAETIENNIDQYIEENIHFCFDNFSAFRNIGFDIEYGDYRSDTTFTDNGIAVVLHMQVTAQIDGVEQRIESFFSEFESDLPLFHSLIEDYLEHQHRSPKYIRTSYLAQISAENGIDILLKEHPPDIMIFQFVSRSSILEFDNYTYNFAVRYDWDKRSDSTEIFISDIPDMTAVIGYEFSYQVIAHGDGISFSDNSPLFDIDETTGLIRFTPEYEDTGEHIITIRDKNGVSAQKTFKLTIENFGFNPMIDPIGYLSANAGEEFLFTVNAYSPEGHSLIFIDDSDLFSISPHTGQIRFTPRQEDIGSHAFNIRVIDETGNQANRNGYIIVQ